ncbi:MAG TPA: serine hydrolase domain-containing protein [Flavobacterium sp.]|jgi:CubicO group peptidase (beta-lactamase class C family)
MSIKSFGLAMLLVLCSTAYPIVAQEAQEYPRWVQENIVKVENNLFTWVRTDSARCYAIEQRMKARNIKGVSIAVIHNYQIEWAKGYGWADTLQRLPVTPSTLFQTASIGKSVHAFTCLHLAEKKKLSLDNDINIHLRSWKFPYDTVSQGKPITLAAILSHSAGLGIHGFDGYKVGQPLPRLINVLNGAWPSNSAAVRSKYAPGIKAEYSGGGYEISELLVQDVTGSLYGDYISRNIFKPLKMKRSTYELFPESQFGNSVATAYRSNGKPIGCKYHLYPEKACGAGLWSTAPDIAQFVIAVQKALAGHSKMLSREMAQKMVTPYLAGSDFAMGAFAENRGGADYFQHSGLNEGFSSQYYGSVKNGNGVVVLTNGDDTRFVTEVVNSVAWVYGWKDFTPFQKKNVVRLPDHVLLNYVGKYQFKDDPEDYMNVAMKDGVLMLVDRSGGNGWPIYFTSATECFMEEAPWVTQVFTQTETGSTSGFNIIGGGMVQFAKKVQ